MGAYIRGPLLEIIRGFKQKIIRGRILKLEYLLKFLVLFFFSYQNRLIASRSTIWYTIENILVGTCSKNGKCFSQTKKNF